MHPHPLAAEAAQCLGALYEGIKHNKTITSIILSHRCLHGNFPMLDFETLMQNNRKLVEVNLLTGQDASVEDVLNVARAFESTSLKRLGCYSDNNECFESIIASYYSVDKLRAHCNCNFQCNAVATLLRDPRAVITALVLVKQGENINDGLSSINASLFYNKSLRTLDVGVLWNFWNFATFHHLLCKSSSIAGICNSNHTIEEILGYQGFAMPGSDMFRYRNSAQIMQECLELNRIENNNKVIQKKFGRYYFIGCFDLSPFVSMPVSLLPRIMELIEGESGYCRNAIFRLLRNIPDLLRFLRKKHDTDISDMPTSIGYKRKKVDGCI